MGLVDVSEGVRYLEQNGIPNYVFPEEASRTMAAMIKYSENLKLHKGSRIRPYLYVRTWRHLC